MVKWFFRLIEVFTLDMEKVSGAQSLDIGKEHEGTAGDSCPLTILTMNCSCLCLKLVDDWVVYSGFSHKYAVHTTLLALCSVLVEVIRRW